MDDARFQSQLAQDAHPSDHALDGSAEENPRQPTTDNRMSSHVDGDTAAATTEQKEDKFHTFKSIAQWNLQHLRANPLAEISGSLGDLGTLLPILIALAQLGAIDLASTLVVTGLASIVAGSWFGYPLAVQPMKAIAGIVLARGMGLRETISAGLTTATIVAVFSIIGIQILIDIIPLPVVRGNAWSFYYFIDLQRDSNGCRCDSDHQFSNTIIGTRLGDTEG